MKCKCGHDSGWHIGHPFGSKLRCTQCHCVELRPQISERPECMWERVINNDSEYWSTQCHMLMPTRIVDNEPYWHRFMIHCPRCGKRIMHETT